MMQRLMWQLEILAAMKTGNANYGDIAWVEDKIADTAATLRNKVFRIAIQEVR